MPRPGSGREAPKADASRVEGDLAVCAGEDQAHVIESRLAVRVRPPEGDLGHGRRAADLDLGSLRCELQWSADGARGPAELDLGRNRWRRLPEAAQARAQLESPVRGGGLGPEL